MSRKISNALMGCIASLFAAFAHGTLVDTDGNLATNQTLLGDIDMGVGTLGDLKDYVSPSQITDGTNTIDAAGNVYLMTTGWVASLSASGIASGATSAEIVDKVSLGTPVWGKGIAISGGEPVIGWFVYRSQGDGRYYPDPDTERLGYEYLGAQDGEDSTVLNISFDEDWDGEGTLVQISGTFKKDGKEKIGKLALTNDVPPAVTVVAPSTNAVKGTASDAKSTGTAIYTGFTEWECVPATYNGKTLHVERENEEWNLYADDQFLDPPIGDPYDATSLTFSVYGVTATRHLVTPTKTSQLTNDGSNGVPFAVVSQIPLNYETVSNMAMSAVSTNALEGQTYDFSKNYDIIKATADLIRLFGGTVTNDPTANGGN